MNDKIKSSAKNVAENMFNSPLIDSDLEVWFILEGIEFEVSNFKIRFGQGVDHKGQPQDEARGGFMIVELLQKVPDEIYKWSMTSSIRSGSVITQPYYPPVKQLEFYEHKQYYFKQGY